MNSLSEIVFVASCNVDLIAYVDRMPKLGETINGNEFKMGFGGKGANKCIACSRLGGDCAIICKLGNDIFGKNYFENFIQNNIKTDHVLFTDAAATGVAPIQVDANGDNSIIVILGANLHLSVDDINNSESLIKNAKKCVTNLEIPVAALHSLKIAKQSSVLTLLNFAPAIANIDENFFEYTDIVVLNETEAESLSGIAVNSVDDAFKATRAILSNRKGIHEGIAITLGEKGVIWHSKRDLEFNFHQPCSKVKVVDSAGAGDAFVGAFSYYISKLGLENMKKIIELASNYASITVQFKGTQLSYPKKNDLPNEFQL